MSALRSISGSKAGRAVKAITIFPGQTLTVMALSHSIVLKWICGVGQRTWHFALRGLMSVVIRLACGLIFRSLGIRNNIQTAEVGS